jgi:hypothetical protein
VRIVLDDGRSAYGHVLVEPLIAFKSYQDSGEDPDIPEILRSPDAFRIWVSRRPLTDGRWPVVGHAEPDPAALRAPPFFRQDPLTQKLSITYDGGHFVPATEVECQGLERAAVWAAEHVTERLLDYFENRPNRWVESLRVKV